MFSNLFGGKEMLTPGRKNCRKGFRKNKTKTKKDKRDCVPVNERKRCANGTRKNKKTGVCEPYKVKSKSKSMSKSKSLSKKSSVSSSSSSGPTPTSYKFWEEGGGMEDLMDDERDELGFDGYIYRDNGMVWNTKFKYMGKYDDLVE